MQNKLQEIIELEEREGRAIGEDENSKARRKQDLQQRMDIDDSDIVIQGSTTTRLSRKQVSNLNQHMGHYFSTAPTFYVTFFDCLHIFRICLPT